MFVINFLNSYFMCTIGKTSLFPPASIASGLLLLNKLDKLNKRQQGVKGSCSYYFQHIQLSFPFLLLPIAMLLNMYKMKYIEGVFLEKK